MRRTITGSHWSPATEGTPALVVTAAFFTLGGLAGLFLAFGMDGEGGAALSGYLEGFLETAGSGGMVSPTSMEIFWRAFRWFLGALLLGLTAFGLIGLPLLSAARGFLLAFSISSFAWVYGRGGLSLAFFLLGIPALATIPAFFVLSVQSLQMAWKLAARSSGQGKREMLYHREHFLRCGVCAVAVWVGFLLERYLTPVLVMGIAGTLLQ